MQFFLMIFILLFSNLFYSFPLYANEAEFSATLCHDADKIFTNATFLTLNPKQPIAKALAVTKERIVAVGDEKLLFTHCRGQDTKIIDLKNTTVTPGFIDAYSQFVLYGWLANNAIDLSSTNVFQRSDWKPIKTLDQFLTVIKTHKKDSEQWLIFSGYDESRIRGEPLTGTLLEEITNDSPVIVFYASGEKALLNQAAINKIKDENNGETMTIESNGTVHGASLNKLLSTLITTNEAAKAIKTAANHYARQGYTTITQVYGPGDWLRIYDHETRMPHFPVDVIYNPSTLADKQRLNVIFQDNPRLYSGPLLLQVDGMAQDLSAYLTQPYFQSSSIHGRNWHGSLKQSPKKIEQAMSQANKKGFAIAFDSHGDAATDFSLNIIQKMQLTSQNHGPKPVIFNVQYIRDDQLNRMRQMGIKASWFGPYLYYWGESMCYEGLGSERAHRSNPLASAKKILGSISVHAGTPSAPPTPLQIMNWLTTRKVQRWNYPVNRKCPQYFAINERISTEDALRMFTINAAEFYGIDADKGSLIPGKLADMSILSGNPLENNAQTINVLGTIARGVLHWNRPNNSNH
ncbi:amidohydrolase [Legionella nagasakiensis]|uniref:amidohydrolase n=1 Tax=Legionella nagasakiensis TaxID=535290 RepID=UPI001056B382|nr:amidohydrolase family protein [Legionella nagasakiensis]